MKKVLFLDRDGTLIIEPPDEQVDSLEKLEFYPGVMRWLGRIAEETDFELVIVTNQDGLGTGSFAEDQFLGPHTKMLRTFSNEGIHFSDILIDRSKASEKKPTRKPGTGMLTKYLNGNYDLAGSYVIGDRLTDVELAKNLGARAILLNNGTSSTAIESHGLAGTCALITGSWEEIYRFVRPSRTAAVTRNTRETQINATVNLDGTGRSKINTGLAFFDHMLEQLAKHANLDLEITVKGDLHVDEHHTIEDTALALGEAINKALGQRRGIQRYGFLLPMDDALAQVAIDLGGRPWLVWEGIFKREKIGDMPTEMFMHFFKSFSDMARCTLNIKVEGQNEHHMIESVFKAFAKALKQAVQVEEGNVDLPTTKGRV